MKNSNSNTSAASGGIGFTGILTIAFIVLKLVGVINWSWWWVLSPLWISAGLVLFCAIVTVIVTAVVEHKTKKMNQKKH